MLVEQTSEETQQNEQPETTETPPEEGQGETPPEEPTEAKEEAGPEGEEGEKPPEDKPETPEQRHKRTGGYQRKIDRLERMVAEKDAMLAQALGRMPQPGGETKKEQTPAEQAQEYIRGLVSQQLEEERARQRAQAQHTEFQKRMAEAQSAHADFEDVVLSASNIPVSPALSQALLTSERPGEIMYQLAKSPAELARISALPPLDAAREIGRLEAKFVSGATPQARSVSANRPPAPPSRVAGSSPSTRRLEDLPISEYKRAYRSKGR